VVALEALQKTDRAFSRQHDKHLDELEARLHALELAIIADVAEIENLKTLAEQGTDLFEEHDERLQALERPAAPAQRQPAPRYLSGLPAELVCGHCSHKHCGDDQKPTCSRENGYWKFEQPRQGAGQ